MRLGFHYSIRVACKLLYAVTVQLVQYSSQTSGILHHPLVSFAILHMDGVKGPVSPTFSFYFLSCGEPDLSNLPKLLMIAERFPPDLGGVARSAVRLAQEIGELGWEVQVMAWTKTLPAGVLESDSIPVPGPANDLLVHRLGMFSNLDSSMQHMFNALDSLHQEFGYLAAWGHYVYPAGYMAVAFAEMHGLRSTVGARGNDVDRLMFPPGDFARLLWTLERATLVNCVSNELAKKVRMLANNLVRVEVLRNTVNTEVFRPIPDLDEAAMRKELGIEPEEFIIGFCGELRHKKGLPHILTAMVEVRQACDACLLVIGEIRPRERSQLMAFAAEHPEAAKRIIVTGRIDEQTKIAQLLNICDVCLQPSFWDGFPNAVLEAMACENIVIGSDAGGIPEMIDHGENGFVIPKSQLSWLGKAILEVRNSDTTERQRIGTAARRTVQSKFRSGLNHPELKQILSSLEPSG